MATRRPLIGTEVKLAQTYGRLYPGRDRLGAAMYRSALDLGLAGQVHDLTAVFNDVPEQVYMIWDTSTKQETQLSSMRCCLSCWQLRIRIECSTQADS
jgi:hypothetical protein